MNSYSYSMILMILSTMERAKEQAQLAQTRQAGQERPNIASKETLYSASRSTLQVFPKVL